RERSCGFAIASRSLPNVLLEEILHARRLRGLRRHTPGNIHRQPTSPEGDDAVLAPAGVIQHEQTAALRLFLLTGRRCGFDMLAQILAERTFAVGSPPLPRYQPGKRAAGSGHARQNVQQGVDPVTELRTRVAAD